MIVMSGCCTAILLMTSEQWDVGGCACATSKVRPGLPCGDWGMERLRMAAWPVCRVLYYILDDHAMSNLLIPLHWNK